MSRRIIVSFLFLILGAGIAYTADAQTTIFSENFDDGQYCFQGYAQKQECSVPPPSGWYSQGGWWKIGRVCDNIYRGSGNWANSAFQGDPWSSPSILSTKAISLSPGISYSLKFYARTAGSCILGNGKMYLNVFISNSQFAAGTQIGGTSSLSTGWSQKIINFTVPTNGTYYIQFQVFRGGDGADYTILDDIILTGVSAPFDFSIARSPISGTVEQGKQISINITTSLSSGSTQLVSFVASNLPSGATAVFSPSSCSLNCNTVLTISTSSSTPIGSRTITVTATGGGKIKTTSYVLTVSASSIGLKPTVATNPATSIASNSAVLNGSIISEGGSGVMEEGFDWGISSGGYSWSASDTGYGVIMNNSKTITGLTPGTKYYFRYKARNSAGWTYGAEKSFTTLAGEVSAPIIATNPATSITTVSATLNGKIDSTGGSSVLEKGFDWGTSPGSYFNQYVQTGSFSAGSFSKYISGLTPGTKYYFRAKARNSSGWTYGNELSFTANTSPTYFSISRDPSSGTISPGESIQTTIEASLTSGPANSVSFSAENLPSGATAVFSPSSCSLNCNTVLTISTSSSTPVASKTIIIKAVSGSITKTTSFYLKVVSTAEETSGKLIIATNPATSITTVSATLNGKIDSTGGSSVLEKGFDWGTNSTTFTGTWTQAGAYSIGSFAKYISGLNSGTKYYFRAKARNSSGWTYGNTLSFTAGGTSLKEEEGDELIQSLLLQIQQLTSQIAQLQNQLANIQGTSSSVWCHTFNANMAIGSSGTEVLELKTALIKNGVWPYEDVTDEFDEETASYVVAFQQKYRSEILIPWRLANGTGFVGSSTRSKLNSLYGCR